MQLASMEPLLPPGYRFHPTDEELIVHYLMKKTSDPTIHVSAIAEVDLNKSEPWDLPGKARMGEKEWYFFSLRDRKYPTGLRTNRATEAGYWKATGKDREVVATRSGNLLGMKKTLVFYIGRAPKGEKTCWIMHEYRLEGDRTPFFHFSKLCKEEWVVCRVFRKNMAGKSKSANDIIRGSPDAQPSLPPLLDSPNTTMNIPDQQDPPIGGVNASCENHYQDQAFSMLKFPLHSNAYDPNASYQASVATSLPFTFSIDHLLNAKDFCKIEPYVGRGTTEANKLDSSFSESTWQGQLLLPLHEVANLIYMSGIAYNDNDQRQSGEVEVGNAFNCLISKYAAEQMGVHGTGHLDSLWV